MMDIAWIFRPALDKITSSIPSAGNYDIITRVLSLTGSFNDRTSLLLDDAGPAQAGQRSAAPTQAQDDQAAPASATTTAVHAFDIEAATTPLQAAGEGGAGHEPAAQDAESKRVAKTVQTVCLFAASDSLVLFVNRPNREDPSQQSKQPATGAGALYSAGLAFISLGFFSSLGLSMFSIVARPGEAAVARVQKWGMVVAVASVLVAFTLRMCMMV